MLRLVCAAVVWSVLNLSAMAQDKPLVMIVTDPLSARNACDCVSGYAQRDYDKLAAHLKRALHRNVDVVYAESFVVALKEKTQGQADIVIGKDSVIRYHAKALKLPNLEPMARLTDQKGLTTMKGLFVVKNDSPAASVLDLEGFRVFYGPEACDEKWAAPKAALKKLDIPTDDTSKSCDTCSIAAKELVALPQDTQTAAVISSYAIPLLEGCGTIKKGALRVVGETDEVPFITCFVNNSLPEELRSSIRSALMDSQSSELLAALESKSGFVPYNK